MKEETYTQEELDTNKEKKYMENIYSQRHKERRSDEIYIGNTTNPCYKCKEGYRLGKVAYDIYENKLGIHFRPVFRVMK